MANSDYEDGDEGNKLHKYKNMTDKISHNQDSLVWWKYNEKIHPAISQVAKKNMSVVATSVPCKRLFSENDQVVTKKKKIGCHQTE